MLVSSPTCKARPTLGISDLYMVMLEVCIQLGWNGAGITDVTIVLRGVQIGLGPQEFA